MRKAGMTGGLMGGGNDGRGFLAARSPYSLYGVQGWRLRGGGGGCEVREG